MRHLRNLLFGLAGLGLAGLDSGHGAEALATHFGMCDASAGVALGADWFVVANDEDNRLRIYSQADGQLPLRELDLSAFLLVDKKHPETDLEGAARLGEHIYWITSHGRNSDAEFRESRHRFFATRMVVQPHGIDLVPDGQPYRHLLRDVLRDHRLDPFQLARASGRAPKDRAALNIEGLSATPDGHLLIGFRNPIPQGRALIVPLLNPPELLQGKPARFGNPILLDLDGLGIRDMALHDDGYWIIAGSYRGGGDSRLYRWLGQGHLPVPVPTTIPDQFNPEAILFYPHEPTRAQVLSDDGTVQIMGENCKSLKDPRQKRFRSWWISLAAEGGRPKS